MGSLDDLYNQVVKKTATPSTPAKTPAKTGSALDELYNKTVTQKAAAVGKFDPAANPMIKLNLKAPTPPAKADYQSPLNASIDKLKAAATTNQGFIGPQNPHDLFKLPDGNVMNRQQVQTEVNRQPLQPNTKESLPQILKSQFDVTDPRGFAGTITSGAKAVTNEVQRLGVEGYNTVSGVNKALHGDVAGANAELDKPRTILGSQVKPTLTNSTNPGAKELLDVAGQGASLASNVLFPTGAYNIATQAGEQTLKAAIINLAKTQTLPGALMGLGSSLQQGDNLKDTFKNVAINSLLATVVGAGLEGKQLAKLTVNEVKNIQNKFVEEMVGKGYSREQATQFAKEGGFFGIFDSPKVQNLNREWDRIQEAKNNTDNQSAIKRYEKAQKAIENQIYREKQAGFIKNPFVKDETPTPPTDPKSGSPLPDIQPVPGREISPTATTPAKTPSIVNKSSSSDFTVPEHTQGSQPEQITTSIDKITQALRDAKPLRAKQEQLYTQERGQRMKNILDIRSKTGGEQGFYKELGALKGEMTKVDFSPVRGIVEQKDIDNLFNAITQSNKLGEWEKIPARKGLAKLFGEFGGQVPTRGELAVLDRVFPDLTKQLMDKRSIFSKAQDWLGQAVNVPRSLVSSLDLSAPLRQGLFLVGKPKQFFGAFKEMIKAFGSEKSFKAIEQDIVSRPSYGLMRDSKLAITDVGASLTNREERFMSNWAEKIVGLPQKIPVIGKFIPNPVRASSRAYTGFLNKLRADVFDNLITKAQRTGVEVTPRLAEDVAKFINSASGRGKIGALEQAMPVLQNALFSPRLMFSRINLLNPVYYARLEPFARKEALKTMASSGSIILTIIGLAKMGGASVSTDMTNADFAKIKIGNTRIDVMGGIQQYLRLGAQLAAGKITSSTTGKTFTLGEGYKPITRKDIIERFFQGKENPAASFITDWLQGQDQVGNKFNLKDEVMQRFIPLLIQDYNDTIKEQGLTKGTALTLPGVFGAGVQTYKGVPPKDKPVKRETRSTRSTPRNSR